MESSRNKKTPCYGGYDPYREDHLLLNEDFFPFDYFLVTG